MKNTNQENLLVIGTAIITVASVVFGVFVIAPWFIDTTIRNRPPAAPTGFGQIPEDLCVSEGQPVFFQITADEYGIVLSYLNTSGVYVVENRGIYSDELITRSIREVSGGSCPSTQAVPGR